jgi:exodeoxyribonuclease V beta subunit
MSHVAQPLNVLRMPLRGRQVIEASAGTGKTWTLAALYLRLVLGHGREGGPLLPPQILVMTFTEAATAELRERIRQRLSDAAQCFDAHAQGRTPEAEDSFTRDLREDIPSSQWPQCALQLHAAADWMDEAAIYTIHGWSRRMLAQHALGSGHLFEQTHLEDAHRVQLQRVQDYWREWFYPLDATTLTHLRPIIGNSPDAWLATLRQRWRLWERSPDLHQGELRHDTPHHNTPHSDPAPDPQQLAHALQQWHQACVPLAQAARAQWTDALWQDLQAHRLRGASDKNHRHWVEALQAWATETEQADPTGHSNTTGTVNHAIPDADTLKVMQRFTATALRDKQWPAVDAHGFFEALQTYVDHLAQQPEVAEALITHAAHHVGQAYAQAKQQRAAFDFQDLLQQLHAALHNNDALATAIRDQYPAALVDEFQDTDPWQYGSLDRIYAHTAVDARHALVMIGDPKQAIYRFRGADLATYLNARDDALQHDPQALHTLDGNHRSSAPLLRAIQRVFTSRPHPFHVHTPDGADDRARIDFVPVRPCATVPAWDAPGARAMTVWHLPPTDKVYWTQDAYLHTMAERFASHMVDVLNHGWATPGDMAVLVRNQHQADALREALRARGVASVYLSDRASVYTTAEALDMWRVLRALAAPRDLAAVRAAVACDVWALPLAQVQALLDDTPRWEALLTRCHAWHQRWQTQGVLPMLYDWLHQERIAQRLLARPDGERRLSHLLHLGELLQHASVGTPGPHALVRWLQERIDAHRQHNAPTETDAQKTRLETDAQCVQVITYHKSKGLQYPLVFLPYLGSFSYTGDHDDDPPEASVEEDLRLIYVALTRAQRAVWLGMAETPKDINKDGSKRSALSHLLQRQTRGDLIAQLQAQWRCDDITVSPAPEAHHEPYRPATPAHVPQAARTPQRQHHSPWWTASFSTLSRELTAPASEDEHLLDAVQDAAQNLMEDMVDDVLHDVAQHVADDNPDTHANPWQRFPAGARYGTLLHDLLQWQTEHGWPLAQDRRTDSDWSQLLRLKTEWLQLSDADLALVEPWLQRIMGTLLPGPGVRLQDLSASQCWAEMAFHFPLAASQTEAMDALVTRHVLPGEPRPALQPRALQGMMTGFMDVVFTDPTTHRYWVLDYKSNRLDRYDDASLARAVLDKRYDVQYTLYTLALHRLLRARLPGYDYDTHMGGAVYVFLRGIDAPNAGTHTVRVPRALIDALDAMFQGVALPTPEGQA